MTRGRRRRKEAGRSDDCSPPGTQRRGMLPALPSPRRRSDGEPSPRLTQAWSSGPSYGTDRTRALTWDSPIDGRRPHLPGACMGCPPETTTTQGPDRPPCAASCRGGHCGEDTGLPRCPQAERPAWAGAATVFPQASPQCLGQRPASAFPDTGLLGLCADAELAVLCVAGCRRTQGAARGLLLERG